MKCKTCQHAIKLHKHPLNRMFNGAISEQVDFGGCIALGKDNGVIVDRVVEECEGWMGKPKPLKMSTETIKTKICYPNQCDGIHCDDCIFYNPNNYRKVGGFCHAISTDYDWQAIAAHDFDKTEVTIEDLEQFKIK